MKTEKEIVEMIIKLAEEKGIQIEKLKNSGGYCVATQEAAKKINERLKCMENNISSLTDKINTLKNLFE